MASSGTVLPSGSVPSALALAGADPPSEVAMLTLQAAESRASGTRVAAFWRRPNRTSAIAAPSFSICLDLLDRVLPSPAGTPPTRVVTRGLRESIQTVTWVTPETDVPSRYVRYDAGAGRCGGSPPVGDNDPVTTSDRRTTASEALFERARAVTPGGVNSPVRAFNAVGGTPRFIRSARGAWLTDVDGNDYVDLVCSWGAMLLGHAHPEVQEAVAAAVARGTSYGTPTEPEVELAEEIVGRTPDRPGPLRLLGHRGHHVRDPAGPRRHRSRRRGEVRRLLPRPRRLAAGRGGLGAGHLRAARHPRRTRRPPRP